MFQSRKGFWFPLSILILCASTGSVCSTKKDEDTIGNAFGSLFKAILNVVKSQFEATKDFVPGLETADGGTTANNTDQNVEINGTRGKDNNDVKVDMKVGMKSEKVFVNDKSFVQRSTSLPTFHEDVSSSSGTEDHDTFTEESIESTIARPGPENQGQSVSENSDADLISGQEYRGQSVSGELNLDQKSSQGTGVKMTNEAYTTVPLRTDEHQSSHSKETPGNSKLPVVSFSSAEALSPEESLQRVSGVQGSNVWPFQPDVKEMLGVLEQEITEPVDDFNSKSNVGEKDLDKAGFVHAENMTEIEMSTMGTSNRQIGSLTDGKARDTSKEDVQYQSQETGSKISNHGGTELGQSESLSNSIDKPKANDSDTTSPDFDDNLSSNFGGNDGEKALSDSIQGFPVPKEDGGNTWPFQQDIGGMVQTLENELHQHGISPPRKSGQGSSQGHRDVGGEELNNDIKTEQSDIKNKEGNIQADQETNLSNEESIDQKNSHNSGETKATKGSDESNTLLRLVNTI